jgi:hypothetical protein
VRVFVLGVRIAFSLFLVLATVALWAIGHGTEVSGHPGWHEAHDSGLLRYYSVSATSPGDGTVERRSAVHAWRLAATILLTGVLCAAIAATWVLARRSRAR